MKKWLIAAGILSIIISAGIMVMVLTEGNVSVGASKVYKDGTFL
ncbi:hypothetical protein [Halobacillus trueperi]